MRDAHETTALIVLHLLSAKSKITNNNLNLVKFIHWRYNVNGTRIEMVQHFENEFITSISVSRFVSSVVVAVAATYFVGRATVGFVPFSIGFVEFNSNVILWFLSSSHRLQTAKNGISSSGVDNSLNYILHYFPIDYDACEPVGTNHIKRTKNIRQPDLSCSQISLSSATVSSDLFS